MVFKFSWIKKKHHTPKKNVAPLPEFNSINLAIVCQPWQSCRARLPLTGRNIGIDIFLKFTAQ